MPGRVDVPFTNEHFAAFCLKMVGQPYWYGTCLYKCSASLLKKKSTQYPTSYAASRQARYNKDIAAKKVCADCIGGAKGYAWTGGGQGVLEAIGNDSTYTSRYSSNNCPDKGANSMFTYAKKKGLRWGDIDTLPEIIGLALYKTGHVGYYVGGGYAVEWKGFSYGCVKTKVAGRGWTHWYELPFIQYGEVAATPPAPEPPADTVTPSAEYGSRLLRYRKGRTMLKGNDVLAVQARLIELGYDPGTADGVYGPKTAAAVTVLQAERGIAQDGIVGPDTRRELSK